MERIGEEQKMTTKEVAESLGVTERSVRRHAQKLGITRNGVNTLITEKQATDIKNSIAKSGRNDLDNVVQLENVSTESEENEIVMQALAILKRKSDEYKRRAEIAETKCIELQPKADYTDLALKTENQMSITDAGKTLGIRQSVMFDFLRRKDLLTCKNVPTQRAIDKKVLTLKSYIVDNVARKSACLTMQNLKNFKEIYIDTGILVVNELDKIEKQGEKVLESKLVKEIN